VGPRASLDSGKSRPTGIRSPDPPARSQSLYRLSYTAHSIWTVIKLIYFFLVLTTSTYTSVYRIIVASDYTQVHTR
jgi:hypothetical protein